MAERKDLQMTIERIQKMEAYFDEVVEALKKDSAILEKDASVKEKLQILIAYYENGQWLADYESDERGELPAELKRGILSQDGLYNLLSEIKY